MRFSDGDAMRYALDLAWKGWGRVHPNPMVGAVVLRDEELISEGWHAEYGQAHAEAVALQAAGSDARGSTLVVTLEPCRHRGKQPPCVDAVVDAGVRKVIIGIRDPHSEAGGGSRVLTEAGLEVVIMEDSAIRSQNAMFVHAAETADRPFVALKLATSVDARVADHEGRSQWISGTEAREYVHWLRAGFDAIAVGARTAREDDPSLTVRGSVMPRVPPHRLIFSQSGNVDAARNLIDSARDTPVTLVVVGTTDLPTHLHESGVETVRAPSLPDALRELRRKGVDSLLVEGGGTLAGALLDAGIVDRFYWIQSPRWLGPEGRPAFGATMSPRLADARRWAVIERRPLGGDTLLVMDRPCSQVS